MHLRFSLLQVMKVVAFCAVAFACVAPMLHLWRLGAVEGGSPRGLVLLVLFEAVAVPLAWAGLSFLLVRRGPWRDRAITVLLLCPVVASLGVAGWLLFSDGSLTLRTTYGRQDVPFTFLLQSLVVLVLSAATLYLFARLNGAFRRNLGLSLRWLVVLVALATLLMGGMQIRRTRLERLEGASHFDRQRRMMRARIAGLERAASDIRSGKSKQPGPAPQGNGAVLADMESEIHLDCIREEYAHRMTIWYEQRASRPWEPLGQRPPRPYELGSK